MTLSTVSGLGSLLAARELDEVLRCKAGRRSSEPGRGDAVLRATTLGRPTPFAPRKSKALLGRRVSFSGEIGRIVARIRGRSGVAAGLDCCLE
jgi:hypothetical protein